MINFLLNKTYLRVYFIFYFLYMFLLQKNLFYSYHIMFFIGLIWAVLIVLYDIKTKKIRNEFSTYLKIILLLIYLITTVLNFSNTSVWGIWYIPLLFIFLIAGGYNFNDFNKEKFLKEFKLFGTVYVVLTLIISAITLALYYYSYKTGIVSITVWGDANVVINAQGYLTGFYRNSNYAAAYVMPSLIFSIYFISIGKNKIVNVISLILTLFVLYFAVSRSIYIGIFTALYFIFASKLIYKLKNIPLRIFLSLILVVLFLLSCNYLIVLLTYLKFGTEFNIIKLYLNKDSYDPVAFSNIMSIMTSWRYPLWQSGIDIFNLSKHYLFGNGLDSGYITAPRYLEANTMMVVFKFSNVHNVIVNSLQYTGLFGFTALIAYFIHILKLCFTTLKKLNLLKALIVSYIIVMLVDSLLMIQVFFNGNASTYIFWIFVGYLEYNKYKDILS